MLFSILDEGLSRELMEARGIGSIKGINLGRSLYLTQLLLLMMFFYYVMVQEEMLVNKRKF
jgi:hypothetical protein